MKAIRAAAAVAVASVAVSLVGSSTALASTSRDRVVGAGLSKAGEVWGIDGVNIDKVLYDGSLYSVAYYDRALVPTLEALGLHLNVVVDHSAIARGYVVAFTSARKADVYLAAHGMPSTERLAAAGARPATSGSAGTGSHLLAAAQPAGALLGCSLYQATYLYDGASCSGSALGVGVNENIVNLGTYGFDNLASSASVGTCTSELGIYVNTFFGGSSTTLHGGDVYTAMPSGFNNDVSSVRDVGAASC